MTDVPMANPAVGAAAIDRVQSLLEAGMLADGPEVRAFESAFADYCGTDHGVATTNGTTALHATLEALGVSHGDAVVTSPFSFVASANVIRLAGATPVFADVDSETYTIDPDAVERIVDRRDDVVGLLPVHLYGLPADMPRLSAIAAEHDLFVLEDACQAHGATIDGERVGGFGDAACFSFYPTKNMTTGEGGMVTTDDAALGDRIAGYINHGRRARGDRGYEHAELGHNHRMTSIAAAIGRSQLERLPTFLDRRRENAAAYDAAFRDLPIDLPTVPAGYGHVYHQYTIRTDHRDDLREALAAAGVETSVYYEPPIHRQPAYAAVETAQRSFPNAERAAETVLSLPVHQALTRDDRRQVVDAVKTYFDS